jgi:hypothetical protein
MKPDAFFQRIVKPALQIMSDLPDIRLPVTDRASVMVMAAAGQESGWRNRRQIGIGQYYPQSIGARGYWQCESTWGGPVAINDVMQKTPRQLAAICAWLEIPTDELALYEAIAWNDTLACAIARLLLWQDPAPLPEIGNKVASWDYYRRNWRPGLPHPELWPANYDAAVKAVTSLS